MDEIEYRAVPEMSGYFAGSDGFIYSSKRWNDKLTWRRRDVKPSRNGYYMLSFRLEGKHCLKSVHGLVAAAWLGSRLESEHVRHLNGDPLDNRPINLAYGSAYQNAEDRLYTDTRWPVGEKTPNAKLNSASVCNLVVDVNSGMSKGSAAVKYNITLTNVCYIMNGTTWSHITGIDKRRPSIRINLLSPRVRD